MSFFRQKLFPALAGALCLVFLFLDLTGAADSTWVKFAAICLCGLAAWTGARTPDGALTAAALTFTVAADVFLLLLDRNGTDRAVGVSLFILVQFLYAHRLRLLRGGFISKFALFRLLGLAAALAAFRLLDLPSALAVFYFCNLLVNLGESFGAYARSAGADRSQLPGPFGWGLLLLACCDVCVGAYNLGLFEPFTRVGMWLFYLPSQVLIVLSQQTEREVS